MVFKTGVEFEILSLEIPVPKIVGTAVFTRVLLSDVSPKQSEEKWSEHIKAV